MKKSWLPLILVLSLSLLLSTQISSVQAQDFQRLEIEDAGTSVRCFIYEPKDTTYNSPFLKLNVTVLTALAFFTSLSFKIDSQSRLTVPMEKFDDGYGSFVGQRWDGLVKLPPLTDGEHKITLYLNGRAGFPTEPKPEKSTTIYFEISTKQPKIVNLSIKNQTYNQTKIPLNFTINKPTSWIAYTLDNIAQISINGNTTLNVATGNHTIVVYANDTAGNMGQSEMAHFTVELPEVTSEQQIQSQILLFGVSLVGVVAVVAVFVYFKNRRHRES
ncbi:MAG TPA: hypothetical protein V6C97_21400 [Oculatellaceae cyanobacterium]